MKITTIGEILVDLTQESLYNSIRHFAAYPGGAPANVAVAAARLGARTAFIGCVGNDSFGVMLSETLERNGVDISGLQVSENANTTLAIVTVDPNGERNFSFYRKPGADTQIDLEAALSATRNETGILHFGSVSLTGEPSRSVTLKVVEEARKRGTLITYDPNYRASLWKDPGEAISRMREPLGFCDVLKISDEETSLLSGEKEPEAAARQLAHAGIRLVLVTLGAKGVYYRMGEYTGTVPGFSVKVADTNGAGDTFFGAVLSKIAGRGGLDGLLQAELEEILLFANKAASITTSRHGAIPAMPVLSEVNV